MLKITVASWGPGSAYPCQGASPYNRLVSEVLGQHSCSLWAFRISSFGSFCSPIFFFFLTIIKVYLTKKFNMKMHTTWFLYCSKTGTMEGTCGSSWFLLMNTPIVYTRSKASNMMILFPRITTIPILFCCPLVAISTHSSITRFINGSNPRNIPWTCLPPFNFNDNFLSINFFNSGGWALLMVSTARAQRCLSVPPSYLLDIQTCCPLSLAGIQLLKAWVPGVMSRPSFWVRSSSTLGKPSHHMCSIHGLLPFL